MLLIILSNWCYCVQKPEPEGLPLLANRVPGTHCASSGNGKTFGKYFECSSMAKSKEYTFLRCQFILPTFESYRRKNVNRTSAKWLMDLFRQQGIRQNERTFCGILTTPSITSTYYNLVPLVRHRQLFPYYADDSWAAAMRGRRRRGQ